MRNHNGLSSLTLALSIVGCTFFGHAQAQTFGQVIATENAAREEKEPVIKAGAPLKPVKAVKVAPVYTLQALTGETGRRVVTIAIDGKPQTLYENRVAQPVQIDETKAGAVKQKRDATTSSRVELVSIEGLCVGLTGSAGVPKRVCYAPPVEKIAALPGSTVATGGVFPGAGSSLPIAPGVAPPSPIRR